MKALKGLGYLLIILLIAGGVGLFVYGQRSLIQTDGELHVQGLIEPVQVHRDASDVTHILANDPRDAWMAMGYVHAQERGWQMEFNRRIMRGTLSEVFGEATLPTDRILRALGIHRAAATQLAGISDEARAAATAYSQGVNAFFSDRKQALSPEFLVFGIDPREEAEAGTYWEPVDSMAWSLMMALDLGGNWGNEVARLTALQVLDTEGLWQLFPPYPGEAPAASADLAKLYQTLGVFNPTPASPPSPAAASSDGEGQMAQLGLAMQEWSQNLGNVEGKGSNNWVVDGTRTVSGKPLLANDPHLGLSAPAIWYFARLQAPDVDGLKGMDVIGATLPGTPFVVLGRTPEVAWGFTNTGPDVQDLFLEQINPDNPNQYRLPAEQGEAWADFETRTETIRIKGLPDEQFTVRTTRHGPVISDVPGPTQELIDTKRYALALSWTALNADNQSIQATLESNRVKSVDELTHAFRNFEAPMQNVVMADRSGRIAFKAVGKVPLRSPGNDIRGVAPAPGWESRYDWQGWLPYAETPQDDGRQGWIATANQRIHAVDYPHFLTQDWAPPYRRDRIAGLLSQTPKHTVASFTAIHGDQVSLATQRLLPFLQRTESSHPLASAALSALQGFDGTMRQDSAAPLIYTAWIDEFTRGVIGGRLGQERFETLYGKRLFRNAIEDILERDDQAWCGDGGCAKASSAALDRALDRLKNMQGSDMVAWSWGEAHPAISTHRPFSNVGALAPLFEVRTPTGGDPFTVNVGQYHLNKSDAPFANRHAASLRAIYDLDDPEKSVFIYQTGQDGNVFSPRYRDMRDEWAAVQYRALQMQPASWEHSLTFVP